MFSKSSSKFERVPEETEDEGEGEQLLPKNFRFLNPSIRPKLLVSGAVGALVGFTIAVLLSLWIPPFKYAYGKNSILKQVSWPSPILDDVEIPIYSMTMNGTVWPSPNPNFSRQPPSAENDEEWNTYEEVPTFKATREQILKLGKNPDTIARFDDDHWGFGPETYMIQLDVIHQIHCLNRLRQQAFSTYPGYEVKGMESHDKRMWWLHLSHCVDILYQNLKCNANTDFITLGWIEGHPKPWPDFNVNHKCRSFDSIFDWAKDNAVDWDKYEKMQRPKDAHVWPSPWGGASELGRPLAQDLNETWRAGVDCKG